MEQDAAHDADPGPRGDPGEEEASRIQVLPSPQAELSLTGWAPSRVKELGLKCSILINMLHIVRCCKTNTICVFCVFLIVVSTSNSCRFFFSLGKFEMDRGASAFSPTPSPRGSDSRLQGNI